MRSQWLNALAVLASVLAGTVIVVANTEPPAAHYLFNASYDPTRELYRELNRRFEAKYEAEHGSGVAIRQSHGGSSLQARRAASGEASPDVVTLGLPSDVMAIQNRGLIAENWRDRLPNHSRPYCSTIVFVVRKGNPHGVHDWPDLVKGEISVIVPDPKTSGNGRLAALAAWGAAQLRGASESDAKDFLRDFYAHAPFLLPAARAAGDAFALEGKGDVHIAWENEALREVEASRGALEIVYPPLSILAEPSVAWIDANIEKRHSERLARAYLEFLFSEEAQEIIAQNGYRPIEEAAALRHAKRLPPMELFPIERIAQDWADAQRKFFGEGGIVDAVYTPKPRVE